jgi:hypothetical protein
MTKFWIVSVEICLKSLVYLLEGRERETHCTGVEHHERFFKSAASVAILGTAHTRFAVKMLDEVLIDSMEFEFRPA